ncbi:hypothetical protein LJR175_008345 [Variovorax sp. LjRoot175]|uniref:hypothetical protein n=1 Tax=Variovorax sp. LjRoot175 TaxID=3342276 RepID=UPI003ECEE803
MGDDAKLRAATDASTSLNQNLGVLGTDDAAIYIGLLANTPAEDGSKRALNGSKRVLLGVTGITVIKQLPVSMNLYEVKHPSSTVSRMLANQQKNLAALVAANP